MALSLAGVQYKDERLTFKEFGKMKKDGEFPMGSLPVWIEDGQKFVQSNSILRMIGIRYGLYSEDADEAWMIDSTMEHVEDVSIKTGKNVFKSYHT